MERYAKSGELLIRSFPRPVANFGRTLVVLVGETDADPQTAIPEEEEEANFPTPCRERL